MRPTTIKSIVAQIATEFPCFGQGTIHCVDNPLSLWMREYPPRFALGVDVADVVRRVRQLSYRNHVRNEEA